MLTGTCIFSVLSKVLKVLCTEYYVFNHMDTCCLMSEVSKVHCTECKRMNGTMSEMSKEIKYKLHVLLYVATIYTVAAGHKMISDGWIMFEKTCLVVGTGELPQLLRSLKFMTTPTSTPTPTPTTPVKEEQEEDEGDVTMVKEEMEEGVTKEEPVYIPLGNNK